MALCIRGALDKYWICKELQPVLFLSPNWTLVGTPRLVSCLTKAEESSLSYYLHIARGRIIGFIPLPRVLVLCEMQSASSRIWTRTAVSISYDDNHYTAGTNNSYDDAWGGHQRWNFMPTWPQTQHRSLHQVLAPCYTAKPSVGCQKVSATKSILTFSHGSPEILTPLIIINKFNQSNFQMFSCDFDRYI